MANIRLSTLARLASSAGVTVLGYITGGKPVGLDPSALWPTPAEIGAASNSQLTAGLATKQNAADRGLANGYASLDATGKVPAGQLPAGAGGGASLSDAAPNGLGTASAGMLGAASRADHIHPMPNAADVGAAPVSHTHGITGVLGLQAALDAKLNANAAGAAGGVATLASDGKVPSAQLPPGISQASLDAKADAAATTTALAAKADAAATTAALTAKADANDTRLINAIQPDYLNVPVIFSANYSAAQADNNKTKRCSSATDVTVTLPALSVGTTIKFTQGNTGRMSFAAGAGQTLESVGNAIITTGKGANVVAHCQATNLWNISGNLV